MKVQVAIALAARQLVIELVLPEGSRIADALAAPQVKGALEGIEADSLAMGIWSRTCPVHTALREGDRVELYRSLVADAKALRRGRARLNPSRRSRSAR